MVARDDAQGIDSRLTTSVAHNRAVVAITHLECVYLLRKAMAILPHRLNVPRFRVHAELPGGNALEEVANVCLGDSRKQGKDALAISHNANASNGFTFDLNDRFGKPITKEYAEKRAANEPLTEISQNKGNSETHPLLSTQDEFANFEIMNFTVDKDTATVHGSYVREGLGRGLLFKEKLGMNPYKVGFIGCTDLHGALSSTNEKEYNGSITTRKTDPNFSHDEQPDTREIHPMRTNLTSQC